MTTLAQSFQPDRESEAGIIIGILSLLTVLLLVFAFGLPFIARTQETGTSHDFSSSRHASSSQSSIP